ncbi:MAG: SpoIID/LytB domain-containing protein [Planctomycetota bacterium]|nr:SpoIID/LytB domain-containing protein [Planctomycetota bacterium]
MIGTRGKRTLLLLGLLASTPLLGARACVTRTDYRERVLAAARSDPRLRVALVKEAPSVDISASGPLLVYASDATEPLLDLRSLDKVTVFSRLGKLVWGAQLLHTATVRIVPSAGVSVEINGAGYRGDVRIHADPKGAITCVNEVALETYLAGVIGSEVPTSWPDAALRAQAIVARTYALSRAWERRDALYDMTADTLSQVYRGLKFEDQVAFRIIHETRGVILVYGDKIFPTYYMSVCGGHTASAAKVFGESAIPPLQGTACGYCRGARRYRWPVGGKPVTISEETILARLGPMGISLKRLDRIEGMQTSPDGFATRVSLRHGGEIFTVSAREFRMALGPDLLFSANFEAVKEGSNFVFSGRGWGHGVGMCQWGAHGMARAGFDEREILRHYYPGAALARLSPSPPG